jgi:uncharacterized protein YqeY
MALVEKIDIQLKEALKARDNERLQTLRMLKSDLQYKQIELGHELTDDEIVAVLSSAAKKRSEAVEEFRKGGREDLEKKERAEYEIIKEFLPRQFSSEELDELIENTIAETGASSMKDLGEVMKVLMPQVRGRADGKAVNIAVKAKLAK